MKTFKEIVDGVVDKPDIFVTGTVVAVDEPTLSCDVRPDDGGEVISNAALRVMRYQDDTGFAVVPKVGTEAIVAWLAPNRPTVFQVHEWAKIVCLTPAGFGFTIDGEKLNLGMTKGGNLEPVAKAESLEERINGLENTFNGHIHICGGPGLPSGTPTAQATGEPKFDSKEVFTS
jgi:hypothetical protein